MAARSTGVLSGMKSLPVKVHLSSRAPCPALPSPPLPSPPLPSTPLPSPPLHSCPLHSTPSPLPACWALSISMHTFCEVGQLNWIGPLSVDNPGVAVRQWQSRPSSRCYFNGPLLHSAYTPFKVLFFVKNIGQWHAKSGPKAAHGNFAMRKKKSGSLKKKWERTGRNASHFAHTHTHSAKLVVRIPSFGFLHHKFSQEHQKVANVRTPWTLLRIAKCCKFCHILCT